ncbi:MAG: ABC transporter permease [Victivallaceae bacterium]|nr:ABC transporter permease [Victivallaceae bacterium]
MTAYLIKRVCLAALTLLAILLASYVLLRLAPGDPSRSTIFGEDASAVAVDAEKGGLNRGNAALRQKLNLDKPILYGFVLWLGDVLLRGDFGESASVDPGRPVAAIIMERLPVTVTLNIWAVIVTYLAAIPLGVYGAVKAGGWFDRGSELGLFILYSLPVMWVGLLLQATLCEGGYWQLFPLKGLVSDDGVTMSFWQLQMQTVRHYFLPVLCLAYGGWAGLSRYTRGGMIQALDSECVRTARAKGCSETRVVWVHAFRNALVTLVTLFGGLLPALVAGSVLVEYIFNIPGMGSLALLAMSSRDYPLQMALFAFAGALTLGGILLADLLYMAVDPRIRLDNR